MEKEIENLNSEILVCAKCRLCDGRTNAVPGEGRIEDLGIMFVGEAPGRNEDLEGRPFVGAGGRLLSSLLESVSLKRENVYITNIVKCRPPNNRKPKPDEVETCTKNYLSKQIEILKPKLIVTLGATALQYFTGLKEMGKARGKLISLESGIKLLPTYHPAAVFRNRSYKQVLENDLKTAYNLLNDLQNRKA